MISLIYSLIVVAIFSYFMVVKRPTPSRPSATDSDDDGGEPLDDGLPDLDLPPGISRPINDWEPDYNRRPVRPREPMLL